MSIGRSTQGRDIWVAKVSDNVAVDETEPEVLVDALHHARERLTLEQALYLLKDADRGTTRPIRRSARSSTRGRPGSSSRSIPTATSTTWAESRIASGARTARRPPARASSAPTSTATTTTAGAAAAARRRTRRPGTTAGRRPSRRPRRASCATSSTAGSSTASSRSGSTSRSTRTASRSSGRTATRRRDLPPDMTDRRLPDVRHDRAPMAARNGYTPMQSSDLYVTDGDQIDWMYGRHRIFSFTWELYPTAALRPTPPTTTRRTRSSPARRSATGRRSSTRSGSPTARTRAIDRQQANCGAFFDDFEGSKGWRANPDGTDTAVGGRWQRANPAPTATAMGRPRAARRDGLREPRARHGSGGRRVAQRQRSRRRRHDDPLRADRAAPAPVGPLTFRYYLAHARRRLARRLAPRLGGGGRRHAHARTRGARRRR